MKTDKYTYGKEKYTSHKKAAAVNIFARTGGSANV